MFCRDKKRGHQILSPFLRLLRNDYLTVQNIKSSRIQKKRPHTAISHSTSQRSFSDTSMLLHHDLFSKADVAAQLYCNPPYLKQASF